MFLKSFPAILAVGLSSASASPTPTSKPPSSPTFACSAPPPPSNRPPCQSGSGSYTLQLGLCNNRFDASYIHILSNTTTHISTVFVSPATPPDTFLYPPTFTYGPWAWQGEFAGAAPDPKVPGLLAPTFGGQSAGDIDCATRPDLKPVECAGNAGALKYWYVEGKSGQLFAATGEVGGKGFQRVEPYIVQGCSAEQ